MNQLITIEIPAASAALVRQFLALHEELQSLARSAAEGTVLDACEAAAAAKGRELTANLLTDAINGRIRATEKRGPRSAPARVGGSRRTAAHPSVSS